MFKKVCLFSGNANPALAQEIAQRTSRRRSASARSRASATARPSARSTRTCAASTRTSSSRRARPVNDNVMELLIMVDALRRASAGSITAVIPYYGYARQDRKVAPRTPITSKLVADLIVAAGVNRVVCDRPARRADPGLLQHPVRSPLRDAGAARGLPARRTSTRRRVSSRPTPAASSARAPTRSASTPRLAIIDKRRERANVSEVMHIIGDVEGQGLHHRRRHDRHRRHALQRRPRAQGPGAKRVVACATHAVLSGPAIQRIVESPLAGGHRHRHDPAPPEARPPARSSRSPSPGCSARPSAVHNSDSVSSLFV